MKLCVLHKEIQDETYLYTYRGVFLYYLPIVEYKKQILKGTVSIRDDIIALLCFNYARDILEGRFELGEEAISKNQGYSLRYAHEVLEGRFEIGEEAISNIGYYSYYYATHVLKGRFILGEPVIKNTIHRHKYEEQFNITL